MRGAFALTRGCAHGLAILKASRRTEGRARLFHIMAGVRMQSRSSLLALLAAIVLFTSVPAVPSFAAEPRNATTLAPLPAVDTDDGRFGMVQGIVQPDLAWQAGARWDRIIFPWSLIQRDGPNSWTQLYFTDEAIRAQARRGVTMAGILIYTPQWASPWPEKGRPVDPPRGLELKYDDPNNTFGPVRPEGRRPASRGGGPLDRLERAGPVHAGPALHLRRDVRAVRPAPEGGVPERQGDQSEVEDHPWRVRVLVGQGARSTAVPGPAARGDCARSGPPEEQPLLRHRQRAHLHGAAQLVHRAAGDARHPRPSEHEEADLDRREST